MTIASLVVLLAISVLSALPVKKTSLAGWQPEPPPIHVSIEDWMEENLQQSAAENFRLKFYARTELAMFYNQIRYRLFDDYNPFLAKDRRGRLYERDYQKSVLGEDYIGEEKIIKTTERIKALESWLGQRGKTLVVVLMPCKWRYHRKDWDAPSDWPTSNYTALKSELRQRGIWTIDVNEYFESRFFPHPVYSNNGSHWSLFGAGALAEHFSEVLRERGIAVSTPEWRLDSIDHHPHKADADLHRILNVLENAEDTALAYGALTRSSAGNADVFWLGDSYFEVLEDIGIWEAFMGDSSTFCYYNEKMRSAPSIHLDATDQLIMDRMEMADVVVLSSNERALRDFGWGFLNRFDDER